MAKTSESSKKPAEPGKDGSKGKGGKKKLGWKKVTGRVLLGALSLFLAVSLLGLGTFFYLYATTDLPDPSAEFQTNTTFIYYADGETQLGSLAVQNRETLPDDEIPEIVKDAVIAAENRSFWTDPGFSVSGILRSVFSIVTGGGLQGGSTITQQYIKILYLDSDQTIQRKARELVLATKMGREMPKEEILAGYLNTIYFGRGAYGIQAASKAYFLKPVDQLSVDEVAVLAAVLNNPARLNPSSGEEHRERLLARYRYVLSGMLEMGTITQAEHDRAARELPEFPEVPRSDRYGGPRGFLIHMVEEELEGKGFDAAEIQGGGLRIITTVDAAMQEAAVETAQSYTEEAAANAPGGELDPADLHIALSSVDTRTGGILALYGGPDYVESQLNWAETPRAAASTFKTFAAVAGLRNGFNLDSRLNGSSFTPDGDATPVNNQASTNYGPVTMRRALANSINTAFVDLTMQMDDGANEVIQAANDAGAPNSGGRDWFAGSRIALGAAEVSPTNMANSYGTLVDSGQFKETHIVAQVVDSNGSILYEADTAGEQTVDSNVAANVVDAMTSVVSEGTGRRASELGRPVAGKTGTNENQDGLITTGWFVGATRQVSTAVMFVAGNGNEDLIPYRQPGDRTFFGSGYPLSVWVDYMTVATDGMEVEDFDEPQPIRAERGQTSSPRPTRTESSPDPEPSVSPTPEESPTPSPTPTPTPSPTPTPTPSPTPTTPPTSGPTSPPDEPDEPDDPDEGEEGSGNQGPGDGSGNQSPGGGSGNSGPSDSRRPEPAPTEG